MNATTLVFKFSSGEMECQHEGSSLLNVDTFVGSEASFMSSAHLISGKRDAILVDASFRKSDAQQLAELVNARLRSHR